MASKLSLYYAGLVKLFPEKMLFGLGRPICIIFRCMIKSDCKSIHYTVSIKSLVIQWSVKIFRSMSVLQANAYKSIYVV